MSLVNILEPIQIACLIVGAMMPYAFSALTMKSVGQAADQMCQNIVKQKKEGKNDPFQCIEIATSQSLTEMILPGVMVFYF
jgi:Na+/H+-translocating membrane pyrophosphatase